MRNIMMVLGAAALLIVAVVIGPVAVIWSTANLTLMIKDIIEGVGDPYTWQNWLSVVILGAFFSPNVTIRRKNG